MKSSEDPRHLHRIALMQQLFSYSFREQGDYGEIADILAALTDIDKKVEIAAPEWPVGKIAKIDLAVLRLAIYELTVTKREPPKVVIDEAIELAKQFGNVNSAKFVNGVLGTILKNL